MVNNMLEQLKKLQGNSMIKDVHEKLKVIGADNLTDVQQMLMGIGANAMIKQVHEKLKDLGVHSLTTNMQDRLKDILGRKSMDKDVHEKLKDTGAESLVKGANAMIKQVHEKLKDLNVLSLTTNVQDKLGRKSLNKEVHEKLKDTGAESLMKGANDLSCAPVFITFMVLMLCILFSIRYWARIKATKRMKAPGRNYMLPRHVVESDPRSYFRSNKNKKVH